MGVALVINKIENKIERTVGLNLKEFNFNLFN